MSDHFKNLDTRRLVLRPLRVEDAAAILRYRSDPDVYRYQLWRPRSLPEVVEFTKGMSGLQPDTPGTWYQLAVCLRPSGELIGDCGIHYPQDKRREAEIGITLALEHRSNGYAIEALETVLRYLFDGLGKDRVYATVDKRNQPSVKLLERLSFGMDAPGRGGHQDVDQRVHDLVYSLTRAEWQNRDG